MGFFDSFSETLASTGRSIGSKTKEVAESTKLSIQIAQEEGKLKNAYAALGEAFFKNNEKAMPAEYAVFAADIQEALDKLAVLKNDKRTVTNQKQCVKCGAWMHNDDVYCGKCGAVNEIAPEPEAAPAETEEVVEEDIFVEEPSDVKICPNCSHAVKAELLYCPECGEKL